VLCGAVPILTAWPAPRAGGAVSIIRPPVSTSALADSHATGILVGGYLALVLWRAAALMRGALASKGLSRTGTPITEGPILA